MAYTDMDLLFSTPLKPDSPIPMKPQTEQNSFLNGDFLDDFLLNYQGGDQQTSSSAANLTGLPPLLSNMTLDDQQQQQQQFFGDDQDQFGDGGGDYFCQTPLPLPNTPMPFFDMPPNSPGPALFPLSPTPLISTVPYIAQVVSLHPQEEKKKRGPKQAGKRKYAQDEDEEDNGVEHRTALPPSKKSKTVHFSVMVPSVVPDPSPVQAAEELKQEERRRPGRPPGSKNKTEKKGKIVRL